MVPSLLFLMRSLALSSEFKLLSSGSSSATNTNTFMYPAELLQPQLTVYNQSSAGFTQWRPLGESFSDVKVTLLLPALWILLYAVSKKFVIKVCLWLSY